MPTVSLTDRWVKSKACKPIKGRRTDYHDAVLPKFMLRVSPDPDDPGKAGVKAFAVRYDAPGRTERVRRYVALGTFPETGLADARDEARAVLERVERGEDPAVEGEERVAPLAQTFAELADKFLEIEPGRRGPRMWRPRTRQERRRIIEHELRPRWGDMRLDEITKTHLHDLLDEVAVTRGAPIMANRVRSLVHAMFEFAVDRDLVEVNLVSAVKRPVREEPKRKRVASDDEVRRLWEALEDERPVVRALFRFMLLVPTRIGETLKARWSDIDGDTWSLPGDHTKNWKPHRLPLPPQALDVLNEIKTVTGDSEFVFASPVDRSDGHAHQLWVGQRFRAVCKRAKIKERLVPHDLRRTASTGMGDLGVDRTVITKILNQGPDGGNDPAVTGIYDRAERWSQQAAALAAWGEHVAEIVEPERSEAVA